MAARRAAQGWPRYPDNDLASAVLGPTQVAVFENLYVAYGPEALRMATRLLADPDAAADAVHVAFVEMLRYVLSGRRWHDPGDARAVVMRNTRWAAMKIARQRKNRGEVPTSALGEAGAAVDNWARIEIRQLCEDIVGRLRPRHRMAIHLHFAEGLSHIEAAARMGITATAFESQLARALRAARQSARGMGALPGFALLPTLVRRLTPARSQPPRPRWSAAIPLRRCLTAAVAAAAVGGVPLAALADAVRQDAAPAALVAAGRATTPAETIYDSRLVDVMSPSWPASPLILALGQGRRCGCWILFRSNDGGAAWQGASGPAAVPRTPRLAVAAAFPADPRIFVVSGAAAQPVAETPSFGRPFTAAGQPAPALARVARAADLRVQLSALAGSFVTIDARGGRFCSTDQGASWRRC